MDTSTSCAPSLPATVTGRSGLLHGQVTVGSRAHEQRLLRRGGPRWIRHATVLGLNADGGASGRTLGESQADLVDLLSGRIRSWSGTVGSWQKT